MAVRAKILFEISHSPTSLSNSDIMKTLIQHFWWEDEAANEGSGQPLSYAEAKK